MYITDLLITMLYQADFRLLLSSILILRRSNSKCLFSNEDTKILVTFILRELQVNQLYVQSRKIQLKSFAASDTSERVFFSNYPPYSTRVIKKYYFSSLQLLDELH